MAKIGVGLNTDIDPQQLPEGEYPFALNAEVYSSEGEGGVLSSEMSNAIIAAIPNNMILVGHIYMRDGQIALFMCGKDEKNKDISEIGIFETIGKYTTHVRYAGLKFNENNPIQGVFRLRRGCDKTIYWIEKNRGNVPRFYIFGKDNLFRDKSGNYNKRYFAIQKRYERPANINIKVLNSGGQLESGSYAVGIQYEDDNGNRSEWINATGNVNIYHTGLDRNFCDIFGSKNESSGPYGVGKTAKSIEINLEHLDTLFKFYRICIICRTSGNTRISEIRVTDKISTGIKKYIYTGTNHIRTISEAEFQQDNNLYTYAGSIEQLDNRLIMANVGSDNINWCRLQYYASRIKTDAVIRSCNTEDINNPYNPKNPICTNGGVGYMPGEVYSFGIVYVFEGGIKSPVYHIPGKNPSQSKYTVYKSGKDVFGMDTNNKCEGQYYTSQTKGFDYWGKDCTGDDLEGKPVRHHRFPTRKDINIFPVLRDGSNEVIKRFYPLVEITAVLNKVTVSGSDNRKIYTTAKVKATLTIGGKNYSLSKEFDYASNAKFREGSDTCSLYFSIDDRQNPVTEGTVDNIILTLSEGDNTVSTKAGTLGNYIDLGKTTNSVITDIKVRVTRPYDGMYGESNKMKAYPMGVQFSGIDIPLKEDTNGYKCIGYYIVRNHRTYEDRSIVDKCPAFPTVRIGDVAGYGLSLPKINKDGKGCCGSWGREFGDTGGGWDFWRNIWHKCMALYPPEYMFQGYKYDDVTRINYEFSTRFDSQRFGLLNINDAAPGSSLEGQNQKDFLEGNDDNLGHTSSSIDGMNWLCLDVERYDGYSNMKFDGPRGKNHPRIFGALRGFEYLGGLDSFNYDGAEVYNLSANNKIVMAKMDNFSFETMVDWNGRDTWLTMVSLERDNLSPYSKYYLLPYFQQHPNMIEFSTDKDNSSVVFGGDTYINPVRMHNTFFQGVRMAKRVKNGLLTVFKILGGVLLLLGGLAMSVFTGGAALPALGLIAGGVGVMLLSSGIKSARVQTVYGEVYQKNGINKIVSDDEFGTFYTRHYGADGIIRTQWKGNHDPKPYNAKWFWPSSFNSPPGVLGEDGFSDDTIFCGAELVSDIWIESSVNISLRNFLAKGDLNSYYCIPQVNYSWPNSDTLGVWGLASSGNSDENNAWYVDSNEDRWPRNHFENVLLNIWTQRDEGRRLGRKYNGMPLGIILSYNADFTSPSGSKKYLALNRDYDCLSACANRYPNRIIWSKQSFAETKADNYTNFLPNDYKDIDGSTGDITSIMSFNSNLYVFTTNGIWHIPPSRQERNNNGVITFIGTGEFLAIPARKIVDSVTGVGGGCEHPSSIIKTPFGLIYVSNSDKRIYLFDGNNLNPISDTGMMNWFRQNIHIMADEEYYKKNNKVYPFRDNCFNIMGSGFVTGFDNKTNRLFVSKKDKFPQDNTSGDRGYVITYNNRKYIFRNYDDIIKRKLADGWEYLGIEGKSMKFRKFLKKKGTNTIKTKKTITKQRVVDKVVPDTKKPNVLQLIWDTGGSWGSYIGGEGPVNNGLRRVDYALEVTSNYVAYPKIDTEIYGKLMQPSEFRTYDNGDDRGEQKEPTKYKLLPNVRKYVPSGHIPVDHSTRQRLNSENSDISVKLDKKYMNPFSYLGKYTAYSGDVANNLSEDPFATGGHHIPGADSYLIDIQALERDYPDIKFIDIVLYQRYAYEYGQTNYESGCSGGNGKCKTMVEFRGLVKKDGYTVDVGGVLDDEGRNYNSQVQDEYQPGPGGGVPRSAPSTKDGGLTGNNSLLRVNNASHIASVYYPSKLGEFYPRSSADTNVNKYNPYGYSYLGRFRFKLDTGSLLKLSLKNGQDISGDDLSAMQADEAGAKEIGKLFDDSATKTIKVTEDYEEEFWEESVEEKEELESKIVRVNAELYEPKEVNNSWTLSYSFNTNRWVSFHSFLPNGYISTSDKLFTFTDGDQGIYEHNKYGSYCNYYGSQKPHIVEFVIPAQGNGIFDNILLYTDAMKFDGVNLYNSRMTTFNKMVVYNGYQCSGMLELKVKDFNSYDYITNICGTENFTQSRIDRRDSYWHINEFYDMRGYYDSSMWLKDLGARQSEYYIDKVLNSSSIDFNKDYKEIARINGVFIIVRLIFEGGDNVKIISRECLASQTT